MPTAGCASETKVLLTQNRASVPAPAAGQAVRVEAVALQPGIDHAPAPEGRQHAKVDGEQATGCRERFVARHAYQPGAGPQRLDADHAAVVEEADGRHLPKIRMAPHRRITAAA